MYQASAGATFGVGTTAPGVDVLTFVDDDGSNPFTTYASSIRVVLGEQRRCAGSWLDRRRHAVRRPSICPERRSGCRAAGDPGVLDRLDSGGVLASTTHGACAPEHSARLDWVIALLADDPYSIRAWGRSSRRLRGRLVPLESESVSFAILFGSRAPGGRPRADSDWDVAVYLDERLGPEARFGRAPQVGHELSDIGRVDWSA